MTTNNHGRMLFGKSVILQDWDNQGHSVHAFQYWELFLDLLLVASASAVSDQFKDNLNYHGFLEFIVFYMIILNGWILYSHHFTTRFQDSSLLHSMNLFLYSFGFGLCNVHTGYDTVQQFCWGAILMRLSVLIMLAKVAFDLERARYTCAVIGILTGIPMLAFLVVALFGSDIEEKPIVLAMFWLAAIIESFGEAIMIFTLPRNYRMVPINIEQSKERLGAMEMIFLGETILSVTLIYREMMEKVQEDEDQSISFSFYWVLCWSFLLVFMFLLLYFHMQPDPDDHAFRRSRQHGGSLLILYRFMGLSFLAVGVSVKLVVECILSKEEMPEFASQLMSYAVSFALFTLFVMRYLHYGGRKVLNFGHYKMNRGEDRCLDLIAIVWWWTFGIAFCIPLLVVLSGWKLMQQDPLILIGSHAVFVFVLVLLETNYTHFIQNYMKERAEIMIEEEPLNAMENGRSYS